MWCLCFYIFMWWTLSLNMGFVIAFFLYLNCTVEQSDAISTWIVGWSVGIWFLIGYLSLKLTNRLSVAIDFQCNRLSVAKCNVWRYRVLPAGLTPAAEVCRYKYLASDRLSLYLPLPSDHPSLILVLWCSVRWLKNTAPSVPEYNNLESDEMIEKHYSFRPKI